MTGNRAQRPGIGFLLSQLGGQSSKRWSERLDQLGLEPREVMVFRFVAMAEGRSQTEIARAIGLPASRIVALVDRLEERGWVERRTSAGDRRAHALHLTPRGRDLFGQVAELSAEHEADLVRGLSAKDRATLVELLGRVAAAQGLVEGVHPGFADPRGHAENDDDGSGPADPPASARPARMRE
jgi:DNA-binding MarR family transcriptional regulator